MYTAHTSVIWRSPNGLYDIERRTTTQPDGSRRIAYICRTDFDAYHFYNSDTGTYSVPPVPKYVRQAIKRVCFRTPVDEQQEV